jgi:tight adherence protein B
MTIFVFGLLVFVVSALFLESILYAVRTIQNPDRNKIRNRLKALASAGDANDVPGILRQRVLSEVPGLNRILSGLPTAKRLDRLLEQANAQHPLGFFILLTLVLASGGFLATSFVTIHPIISVIIGTILGAIPFYYVCSKKKRRMNKLERQLPDGLELIARALRAGHAFSSGMSLAVDEFDDPLGTEFGKALDEINFGVSVSDALKNLANRVDSSDLKYFVVSAIIQREAGGNLAEIMDKIAYVIRERFKLRGKIRVLSAEGRLTALVLIALPFLVLIGLYFSNPDYVRTLLAETEGRKLCAVAGFMMAIGVLVIRKMIRIKV